MPINILMPALSPTMEKGNLAKWLKAEGDVIKSGDVLAEIETDKATMEVEAVDEGILGKILIAGGTNDVAVNTPIAIMLGEGETAADIKDGGAPAAAAVAPQPTPLPSLSGGSETAPASAPAPVATSGARVFASPLARRIARDAGLDLSRVTGTGPHGRVVEADVRAALAAGLHQAAAPVAAPAPAASPAPVGVSAASDEQVKKLFAAGSFEEIPHDGMRKTIARRLLESKLTVPHFYLSVDCELDALLALRAELNAASPVKDGKPHYKLSVNDLIIKAMAMALRAVPDANVTWTDQTMLKHKTVDVGVAVSIPGGLITPVIRNACSKSLSSISNEMKDLAGRARARKLLPQEYQGGTTAISNLGMFGIKNFSAVINPPHATILAVGAGEARPVVRAGKLEVATQMSVTLSTDHRAVDGALGAELISAFRTYIEKPMGMLV